MCPVVRNRNISKVDKKEHVTHVSVDIALRYKRDGNYVDVASGYARVSCFSLSTSRSLCLRRSRHIVSSSGLIRYHHVSAVGSPHRVCKSSAR